MIDRARLQNASNLIMQGQLQPAAKLVSALLTEAPGNDDVWALASELDLRAGNPARAAEASRKSLALAPGKVQRHVQYARVLAFANRLADARKAVDGALALGTEQPDHLTLLGSILVRCEAYDEALALYDKALRLVPDFLEATRGLITVYRFLGRLTECEELCDTFLAHEPQDAEIQHLRSSLRTQTPDRNHVEELRGLLARDWPDWRQRVQLFYSLAKELEDLGRYAEAFTQLEAGASLRHRQTVYDVRHDTAIFEAIKQAFEPARLQSQLGGGDASEEPIFVLGMPRSGTTLVERIIASHSDVFAAGELQDFAGELMALVATRHGDIANRRLELPKLSLDVDFAELGRNYLKATRRTTGHTKRFIDKIPLNFLYIGHIRLALPNARIVHVKRDPMDSCYAMYKYLFKQAYPFSYDQESLGLYYRAYRDLMDHWNALFPGQIIEVEYEKLIADQEGESRRLIAALGLHWQDACLSFHRSKTASTTGSASQIRKPVYASSVARWKQYETQLKPLRKVLVDGGLI